MWKLLLTDAGPEPVGLRLNISLQRGGGISLLDLPQPLAMVLGTLLGEDLLGREDLQVPPASTILSFSGLTWHQPVPGLFTQLPLPLPCYPPIPALVRRKTPQSSFLEANTLLCASSPVFPFPVFILLHVALREP